MRGDDKKALYEGENGSLRGKKAFHLENLAVPSRPQGS
jgi:hypothetical protein